MVDGCGNHYGEQIYRLNVGRHSSVSHVKPSPEMRKKTVYPRNALPSLISIRNLAYSILKKLGDDIVKDIEFTELEKCPQCDKDILSVLSCAHVFHRGVMKKFSVTSLQSTMDVDEVDVDPASIEHPKRTKEPGTTCPAR
ncbi:unnamed protein product [Rhizophagus irregularis]|uniref:Uncharacterized protein n=1 Tax=Rhizophagus irregularis TaxID=588596 RepID=A0A915ZGQ4_9GLOM|nr:unnamed protein product [Rhizophagus irregularis]CAB5373689.1 unnamed protein product [Rhizophagus irregularis]